MTADETTDPGADSKESAPSLLPEHIDRLTNDWTLVLTPDEVGGYLRQTFPPLLNVLQGLVTPSGGMHGTSPGQPNTRSVLNVQALDLLRSIESAVRRQLVAWRIPVTRNLKADVLALYRRLDELYRSAGIAQVDFDRIEARMKAWPDRIWDLIDPPLSVPIRNLNCPECGFGKVNVDGDEADILMAVKRRGKDLSIVCRNFTCGATFAGRDGAIELARRTATHIDVDALTALDAEDDTPG